MEKLRPFGVDPRPPAGAEPGVGPPCSAEDGAVPVGNVVPINARRASKHAGRGALFVQQCRGFQTRLPAADNSDIAAGETAEVAVIGAVRGKFGGQLAEHPRNKTVGQGPGREHDASRGRALAIRECQVEAGGGAREANEGPIANVEFGLLLEPVGVAQEFVQGHRCADGVIAGPAQFAELLQRIDAIGIP